MRPGSRSSSSLLARRSSPTSASTALEPKVLTTEANLVLLRIAIGTPQDLCYPSAHEYFIYSAGGDGPGDAPSLEHLPHPYPYIFHDKRVGLLSYDNGGYTIAALCDDSSSLYRQERPIEPGHYDVCILHSRDKVWASRAVNVPSQEQQKQSTSEGFRHDTSKVITIGGGTRGGRPGRRHSWSVPRGVACGQVDAVGNVAPPPPILLCLATHLLQTPRAAARVVRW